MILPEPRTEIAEMQRWGGGKWSTEAKERTYLYRIEEKLFLWVETPGLPDDGLKEGFQGTTITRTVTEPYEVIPPSHDLPDGRPGLTTYKGNPWGSFELNPGALHDEYDEERRKNAILGFGLIEKGFIEGIGDFNLIEGSYHGVMLAFLWSDLNDFTKPGFTAHRDTERNLITFEIHVTTSKDEKEALVNEWEEKSKQEKRLSPSPSPFNQDGLAKLNTLFVSIGATEAFIKGEEYWKTDENGLPIFVYKIGGETPGSVSFYILQPWEATLEAAELAQKELAWNVVKEVGIDTAWLHIGCTAYATQSRGKEFAIPRQEIYRFLGLAHRTDMTRKEKDRFAFKEINRLRSIGLQITRLNLLEEKINKKGHKAGVFEYCGRMKHLWEFEKQDYGQGEIDFIDGEKTPIYEEWQLAGSPSLWNNVTLNGREFVQFGHLAGDMIDKIDRRGPWGAVLAILLTYESRRHEKVKLNNKKIIEYGGKDLNPKNSKSKYDTRIQILNAIEEQKKWGWKVDFSLWPERLRPKVENLEKADMGALEDGASASPSREKLPRGYWDDFLQCVTVFSPPTPLLLANKKARGELPGKKRPLAALPDPTIKKQWTGSDIEDLIKKHGITQRELADLLEISQPQVNMLIKGKRIPSSQIKKGLFSLEKSLT